VVGRHFLRRSMPPLLFSPYAPSHRALAVGNAGGAQGPTRAPPYVAGVVIFARLFRKPLGFPDGLLSMLLPGHAEAGAELCSHPQVGMIQFYGLVGRRAAKSAELAGRHLKKVSLELGGKKTRSSCSTTRDLELGRLRMQPGARISTKAKSAWHRGASWFTAR